MLRAMETMLKVGMLALLLLRLLLVLVVVMMILRPLLLLGRKAPRRIPPLGLGLGMLPTTPAAQMLMLRLLQRLRPATPQRWTLRKIPRRSCRRSAGTAGRYCRWRLMFVSSVGRLPL